MKLKIKLKKHTNHNFIIYGDNKDFNIIICEQESDI